VNNQDVNLFADLHCHSTASDGSLSPQEVVRRASSAGLAGLSLTDHDTVAGQEPARAEAQRLGIRFLTGIEISATFPPPGTLHILGYGIDPASVVLQSLTRGLVEARDARNPLMVARLNELGVAITMKEVEEEAAGSVVGRVHMAALLVRKGYVSSVQQAFDKFLGQGGCAYFDKERLEPRRALELIGQSGGLAVLAHPSQLGAENDAQLERIVKDLVDMGLRGIEVIHSDHEAAQVEKYQRLAGRYGLLKTGGSDFHGKNLPGVELGKAQGRRIPFRWMEELVEALA